MGGTHLRKDVDSSIEVGIDYDTRVARRNAFLYDTVHPNDDGYQYLSTIIENYLLSL